MAIALVVLFSAGWALAQPARRGCPPGQRPSLSGCVDGSAKAQARSAVRASARPKPVPPPDPAVAVERAKPPPLEIVSQHLLIRELLRLEAMLKVTRTDSPDYPMILLRLAEGFAELEAIAERHRARAQAAADAEEQAAKKAQEKKKPPKRGTGTIL